MIIQRDVFIDEAYLDPTGKTFGYWTILKYGGGGYWTAVCKCGSDGHVKLSELFQGIFISCGCYKPGKDDYHKNDMLVIDGEINSVVGLALKYKISQRIVLFRLNLLKWSEEDAIKQPCATIKDRKPTPAKVGFESKSIEKWSKLYGVPEEVIFDRIYNQKWDTNEAVLVPIPPEFYQQKSTRRPRNKLITIDGESKTVAEWSKETGVAQNTIWYRVNRLDWTLEDAITIPSAKYNYDNEGESTWQK